MHGLALLLGVLLSPLGRLGHLVHNAFLVALRAGAHRLVAQSVRHALCRHAAVAYRGIQIVRAGEGEALEYGGYYLLIQHVLQRQILMAQFVLQHGAAAYDVLLAPLLFEPLLYLRAR